MKRLFWMTILLLSSCVAMLAQNAQIALEGLGGKTAVLNVQELKQMPRKTVTVTDAKTKTEKHYEGVLLSTVLQRVEAPAGKALHRIELRDYVEISATDNYRVIFSLAELDPSTHPNQVLLADSVDGKPLDGQQGPFKLIAPDDTRPERWVRMVSRIRVLQVP